MKTITISILICFPLFLMADKVEVKNLQSQIKYDLRRNGQQIEIHYDGKTLFCPNRKGNRGYKDKNNDLYRASRKADHITLYNKEHQALYRLSIKANKFNLTNKGKMIAELRIKNNSASIYDEAHKLIGKVDFDPVAKKNKIKDINALTLLSYKTAKAQYGGAFLLLKNIPIEVRLILMNEFIDK